MMRKEREREKEKSAKKVERPETNRFMGYLCVLLSCFLHMIGTTY